MVFEDIDGSEIMFFIIYATEHIYEDSSENRIEIGCIDSVKYVQLKEVRTELYYKIVISYLQYAGNMGKEIGHNL